jgi:hypothetical protein
MNRREFLMSTCVGVAGLSHVSRVASQTKTIAPNLAALVDDKGPKLFNRDVTRLVDGARNGVRLSEAPGEAVAFLSGIDFATGTIEFDVRRKVQYHSLPDFTWQKLRRRSSSGARRRRARETRRSDPALDSRPCSYFPGWSVFVNDAKDSCLVVNLLNGRKKGLIGLWVGNNSGGDFANFIITPAA